jgi:hypothetical protein
MGAAHGAEELGLCFHGRACQAGVYGHYIGFPFKKVAVDASLAGTSLARNNERYLAFSPAVSQAFLEIYPLEGGLLRFFNEKRLE